MKRIFTYLFIFLLSNVLFATERYQFDPNHTAVVWHASHFGFSHPSGKWYANGMIALDEADPSKSKVHVIIDMNHLTTGLPEFDKHLKGKLFFDVNQYPESTFVSTQIERTGKNSAKVTGLLTFRGVTKPVVLDIQLNKKGINPINSKETLGFTGKTVIKRSDFGMMTLIPGVSDAVQVEIEAEAFKEDQK